MTLLKPLAAVALALSAFGASAVAVDDLGAEFSGTGNGGVRTDGETNGVGAAFTQFTDTGSVFVDSASWRGASSAMSVPLLYQNPTGGELDLGLPGYPAGETRFHPGVDGGRDTVDNAGSYSYDSTGVRITSTDTPVPQPETLALMLAGLGAVGFVAKRRRD